MACIHYASKMQELKINGQIISSPLHPLHLQRMPAERTGAIQLQKSDQHLGKLHRETMSHALWGQVTVFRVEQGLLTAGANL